MKSFNELNSFLNTEGLKDYLISAAQGTTKAVSGAINAPANIGKTFHKAVVGGEPIISQGIVRGLEKLKGNNVGQNVGKTSSQKQTMSSKMVELKLTPELQNRPLKRGDIVKGTVLSKDPYERQQLQGEYMGKSEVGIIIRNPQAVNTNNTVRRKF